MVVGAVNAPKPKPVDIHTYGDADFWLTILIQYTSDGCVIEPLNANSSTTVALVLSFGGMSGEVPLTRVLATDKFEMAINLAELPPDMQGPFELGAYVKVTHDTKVMFSPAYSFWIFAKPTLARQ